MRNKSGLGVENFGMLGAESVVAMDITRVEALEKFVEPCIGGCLKSIHL
jgi:hypothetical protein